MAILDVVLAWVHILCAVLFLGTMFVGTFALMPVVKAQLDYEHRQRFVVNFIPRVRRIISVVVGLLVVTGIAQTYRLHAEFQGPVGGTWMSVFVLHVLLAVVPVAIFILAPRILGAKSKEKLCCDPDADDPPILMGIFSSTGRALHYLAISGGWLAVLCAVILRKVPMGL